MKERRLVPYALAGLALLAALVLLVSGRMRLPLHIVSGLGSRGTPSRYLEQLTFVEIQHAYIITTFYMNQAQHSMDGPQTGAAQRQTQATIGELLTLQGHFERTCTPLLTPEVQDIHQAFSDLLKIEMAQFPHTLEWNNMAAAAQTVETARLRLERERNLLHLAGYY